MEVRMSQVLIKQIPKRYGEFLFVLDSVACDGS